MKKFVALCALCLTAIRLATLDAAPAVELNESARLAAIYDTILQAKAETARAEITRACPPAPPEACLGLIAASWWWQIQVDPNSRLLDQHLERASETAIAAADRWTKREPQRGEAWFYLAGSYAPLTQWRILRRERVAAARDGLRIKNALERAIALDPTLTDAHFGIGLYHYYADVAPTALKMFRWLLLLPGGDREAGLREMLTTRNQGVLLRGEADFQLHYIYVWYERQPERALELLRGLDARYPSNPVFLTRIAEVQRDYVRDRSASRAAWQLLFDRAVTGQTEFAAIAEARARLGLADDLIALADPRRAIDLVVPIVQRGIVSPYGAQSMAQLMLGRAYAALDDRDRAIAALTRAIAIAPSDDPDAIRSTARRILARVRSQPK